jgi:hypothetical protein
MWFCRRDNGTTTVKMWFCRRDNGTTTVHKWFCRKHSFGHVVSCIKMPHVLKTMERPILTSCSAGKGDDFRFNFRYIHSSNYSLTLHGEIKLTDQQMVEFTIRSKYWHKCKIIDIGGQNGGNTGQLD